MIPSRENEKQEVFMAQYRSCLDVFCRYCHGLTGNSDDARDLVSDAILVALENFEKLRKKESFKAWLFGIAREALVLFELSGFSLEEIKKIQGGSLSGVKSRLRRARKQLRIILSDAESSVLM